jgi:ribosomal protein L12E/L44/L45/RPP1/RPP2
MPTLGSSLTERERAQGLFSVQTQDVDFGFADAGDQDYADQDDDQEGDNEEEEEEDEEEEEVEEEEDITPTTKETGKHPTNIICI